MAGPKHATKTILLESPAPKVQNSPTIFGETLAKDLKDLHLEERTLLQYVDDTLITSPTKEASDKNTVATLNLLADKGCKTSKKMAQTSQTRVTYLGSSFPLL